MTQTVNIASFSGNNRATVGPNQALKVATEGVGILSDPFDGTALDTLDRWNSPVLAGTGALNVANGSIALSIGTTASNAASLSSYETFSPPGGAFTTMGALLTFEGQVANAGLRTNTNRFFGLGLPNASFTAATPISDGVGFEVDITGKFQAVVYSNNVRLFAFDLTGRVLDGFPHVVVVMFRSDASFFFIDDFENPVATSAGFQPTTTQLPVRIHAIAHTSPPAVAPTMSVGGVAVIDTSSSYSMVFNGRVQSRARAPTVFKNINAVSVAAETTIWTPASGRKFRLMGFVLETGTIGGNVLLKDNTAGSTILIVPFGAANGIIVSPPMGNGILSAAANNVLTATGTATQTLSGYVFGTEE